jgi:hypothetical protein
MLSMAVRQPAATHHIRNCSLSVIIICKQQWQSVASPCLFFQKQNMAASSLCGAGGGFGGGGGSGDGGGGGGLGGGKGGGQTNEVTAECASARSVR